MKFLVRMCEKSKLFSWGVAAIAVCLTILAIYLVL